MLRLEFNYPNFNVSQLHHQRALLFHLLNVAPLVKGDLLMKKVNKTSFERGVLLDVSEYRAPPGVIFIS